MDTITSSAHSYYQAQGILPEVASLSQTELEDMMASQDKLNSFVDRLPQLSAIRSQCEQLEQQNEALARGNLNRSTVYERARDGTLQRVEELTALRKNFEELTVEHQSTSEKLAPSQIQETVLIAAEKSEQESEIIAEKFLDSNMDVDLFLARFMEKRIETHLRKFKGEKLGSQLRELQKAGF